MQADIIEIIVVDGDQRLADGVEESVGTDKAAFGMRDRLRDQMFAAAETDFQTQRLRRLRKQRSEIGRRRLRQIDGKPWQQVVEQLGLSRLERMAFAPPEKGAPSPVLMVFGFI